MNIKGLKRMLFGEKMPDKDDPQYKERYEREVQAGHKFAKATRIDQAAAKVQGFANAHRTLFLVIVFTFVKGDTVTENREHRARTQYVGVKSLFLEGIVLCQSRLIDQVHRFFHRIADVFVVRCESKKVMVEHFYMALGFHVQRIERRSNILMRELVTAGQLKRVPRTDNNPQGLLIVNWRTLLNKDIEKKQRVTIKSPKI